MHLTNLHCISQIDGNLGYNFKFKLISLIMQQNIFHGAMSLDQLYLARPTYSQPCYQGQPKGVYLCGSGSHPGELLTSH